MPSRTGQNGFSTIELLAALGIVGVVAAAAVPTTTRTVADLRLRGDARGVQNALGLAKMRAAARYSRERLYVDHDSRTYHFEFWNKTTGAWTTEKDPTMNLQAGVRFGFGGVPTPPPSTQATLAQAPPCKTAAGTDIAGTSCITFNSRGVPVVGSGTTWSVTGNSALYITDGTSTYAVTLSATPLIRLWWTKAGAATWVKR